MTGWRLVTPRELGLAAAVLVLPVALVQTGSSLPVPGRSASHLGTPVALDAQATTGAGRHAAGVSTTTTTANERAHAPHVGETASFDRTAGDEGGGVPPAEGDPGRAGGGGSGTGSPGTPAEPLAPSEEPRDPDPAPPDDGSGGAADPAESPSPAPAPPTSPGEPGSAAESRDLTASVAAADTEAEIEIGVAPAPATALELAVNGRPLLP